MSASFPGLQMCPMPAREALQSRDGLQKSKRQRWGGWTPQVVAVINCLAGRTE